MLLSTTYFGPIQWYTKLCRCMGQTVYIEACETFQKQSYRNRCVIASPAGTQALTIPVTHHGGGRLTRDTVISDHGNWRHLHWQALATAYGESAFYEYYIDDLHPFFFDDGRDVLFNMRYLLDYNNAAAELLCRLLDIDVRLALTEEFTPPHDTDSDLRYAIRPKQPPADDSFTPVPYYQVYAQKHGFLPNLSILDLLFNEGPQAVITLMKAAGR